MTDKGITFFGPKPYRCRTREVPKIKPLGRTRSASIIPPNQLPLGGGPKVTISDSQDFKLGDRLVLLEEKDVDSGKGTLHYAKLEFCSIWKSLRRVEQMGLTKNLICAVARMAWEQSFVFVGFADIIEVEPGSMHRESMGFRYNDEIYRLPPWKAT